MQACWRKGGLPRSLVPVPQASSSRTVCQRRSYVAFNPLGWVKEKVAPQHREKQSKEEIAEAKKQAAQEGNQVGLFDAPPKVVEKKQPKARETRALSSVSRRGKPIETKEPILRSHTGSSTCSPTKISGKPIDWAILQMQFSEKRASTRIMNMLATAKDHAQRYKKMDQSKLIVSEAWVTKGVRPPKRIEPRGRNHYGVRHHPNSKMTVVLRHGKTVEEKQAQRREKILKRIVSAGVTREDVPLRNPAPTWCW
ncbi:hypothetical protein NP233_g8675 [Leucocoprinus birnbaumii]|uniref:Ribosomal protein L22 n=1 Tax=Leucocoprinus birnbaumii TaxID=56174 RepID=A0AAD5VQH3_9AGAR|nr:hypothetical protein NP233_g8675 [Leucocoprinus birnbaumii]